MNSRRIAVIVVALVAVVASAASPCTARSCAGDNVPELGLDTPAPSAPPPRLARPSRPGRRPGRRDPGAATGRPPSPAGDLAGPWTIVSGVAGYRVRETFLQQNAETDAVGRTEGVTGTLTVDGETGALRLVSTQIMVDMTTLRSDKDRRDGQLRGRGIQSDTFPTSTFDLATPVALPADFGSGDVAVDPPREADPPRRRQGRQDRGPGPPGGGRHRRRRREPAHPLRRLRHRGAERRRHHRGPGPRHMEFRVVFAKG